VQVKGGRLVATTDLAADTLSVKLEGTADLRSVAAMDEFVRKAHAEAVAASVTTAIIDLRELEFMSSSNFIRLVAWIGWIEEAPRRYRLRFRSSRRHHWQKRSLHALRSFATELVVIETD
jgi:hypothetical protein